MICFSQFVLGLDDFRNLCLELFDPPFKEQDQALEAGPSFAVYRPWKSGHFLLWHLNQLTAPGNLCQKRLLRR
ncbi:hypothetical protein [Paracoccus aminovorans]|uniref:hypothetical protein n=1 Tax=Paracoccus aminovorans TaxID=34004 RepID=UPI0011141620|nr:hypothetical protein [Paracoccus aminovorans]